MRTLSFVAVFAFVCCSQLVASQNQPKDFADNLLECVKFNDINFCLIRTLQELKPHMKRGIPELGLGTTDPFRINNLDFKSEPGIGVQITSKFTNVIVEGLSGFEPQFINADLDKMTMEMRLFLPVIKIKGNYRANGKVLVVDLDGDGEFESVLRDVVGTGRAKIVQRGQKGQKKLSVKDTVIDFQIGHAQVKLENLFDGKFPALARTVNGFINDNSQAIIDEVKPQIRQEITLLVERILNNALSKFPVEEYVDRIQQQVNRSSRSRPGFRF